MSANVYPAELAVQPAARAPVTTVNVPGSKSITNRALVLAALGSLHHDITLTGALLSEDTRVMVDGLGRLGFLIDESWPTLHLRRHAGTSLIPAPAAELFVANSGTTMRFLTALCAAGQGRYRLDGVARMRERPIEDLLAALRSCGVRAESETGNGCPPVVIESAGLTGAGTAIRGDLSSQFLSALLMVAPFSKRGSLGFGMKLEGPLVSEPYVRMTEAMMLAWGATWRFDEAARAYTFDASSSLNYVGPDSYAIEPDASAASYFWGLAAVTGGQVTVPGLHAGSLQGDLRFAEVLGQMGCQVDDDGTSLTVRGGTLRGIDVDMNDISDTVMTLGAVACFAEGPTTIRNVAHIRHKETDRLGALATELRKLGAGVDERPDGLTITPVEPGSMKGCAVDTYHDHRMAMSLALVGLRVPGVVIRDPGCVAKTYPGFWDDLHAALGG